MKKILILLLILTLVLPAFARLKSKQIVGKWKYEIALYNAQMDGSFVFTQKDGEFEGENIQSDGTVSKLSDIKINKKSETLSFKLIRENDLPIEFVLIVNHNKFKGKGWINDVSFEITGNEITIQ